MEPEGAVAEMQRASMAWHVFHSLGAPGIFLIALGVSLSVWGIVNLAAVRNRAIVLTQVFLSLSPLVVVFVVAWDALVKFLDISMQNSVKADELADIVSTGLVIGIVGPLATLAPTLLGLIKLAKLNSVENREADS